MAEPSFPSEERDGDGEQRLLAEALGDVSAALSSTLELEDVLDLILDRAARVVPYAIGTVLLVEGDRAEVVRSRGYPDSMIGVSFPLTKLWHRLIETGEPVVVDDTRREPNWTVTEEAKDVLSAALSGSMLRGRSSGSCVWTASRPGATPWIRPIGCRHWPTMSETRSTTPSCITTAKRCGRISGVWGGSR